MPPTPGSLAPMIVVYSVALGLGLVALTCLVILGVLASGMGRERLDLNQRLGPGGRMALAGALGFGMGGMAAEFSPLGLAWQVSLVLAVVGAVASIAWIRYLESRAAG